MGCFIYWGPLRLNNYYSLRVGREVRTTGRNGFLERCVVCVWASVAFKRDHYSSVFFDQQYYKIVIHLLLNGSLILKY